MPDGGEESGRKQITAEKSIEKEFSMEDYLLHPESYNGEELGCCHFEGIGIEPNVKRGIYVLKKVIDSGGDNADRARKMLAEYSKNMAVAGQ